MHNTMMTGFSSKPTPHPDEEGTELEQTQSLHDPDDVYTVPVAGVGIGSYKLKPEPHEDKPVEPEKDIPELFKKMHPQREQLRAIIDFCREERTSEEIDAMLEPLIAHRRSVYTPIIMRDLLLRNGALEYLTEEQPQEATSLEAASDQTVDPARTDLEEEVCFLDVPEELPGTWRASTEAIAFIDALTPHTLIDAMLAEKPELEPVYRLVLEECAIEPRTTQYLDEVIAAHPLAQDPPRFGSYFIGRLEDSDALTWEGAWRTTEAARYLIEEA